MGKKCVIKHWNNAEIIMDEKSTESKDCKQPHFTIRENGWESDHIYLDTIESYTPSHTWSASARYLFDWAKDHVRLLKDNYNALN